MDKLDLIKKGIKVAAQCTAQPSVPSVLKTICADFIPSVIDFCSEKYALSQMREAQAEATGEPFDPFDETENGNSNS